MTKRPLRNEWVLRVRGRPSRRRAPKPLSQIDEQLAAAMAHVAMCLPVDLYEWSVIVTYIAVAQRVMHKAPELVRDCAIATETSVLMP